MKAAEDAAVQSSPAPAKAPPTPAAVPAPSKATPSPVLPRPTLARGKIDEDAGYHH